MKDILSELQKIPIHQGIYIILVAVNKWIDAIIYFEERSIQTSLVSTMKKLRASNPVQPRIWDRKSLGQQLLLEFSSRMRTLEISDVKQRVSCQPIMLSEESMAEIIENLVTRLTSMTIEKAFGFIKDLVEEWAMTCDIDLLSREMVEHWYAIPDKTWTDQEYSGYIPYILAISSEH